MSKKVARLLVALVVINLVVACGSTPEPQVVEKTVKETVIVEQTVKETVIVEGTPQVVEKVVTATPEPTTESAVEPAAGETLGSKTVICAWLNTDPTSLDPHVCNESGCETIVRGLYESLIGYKYGTSEIEGVLAESWEASSDGLSWTFKLRSGTTFSDGSPVTADDVVYSFDRLVGIGKGPSGTLAGNYAGADAVDAQTVTVKLQKAIGAFPYMLPRVFIVNSKVVQAQVASEDPWAETWLYDHDAGSGAFVLENWEHGVETSMVKNTNYWDPEWPKIDRFIERLIPETATSRLLMENGEVDIMTIINIDDLPAYQANPDIEVEESEGLSSIMIQMSTIVPPLDDVRIREAIALAFDYEAEVVGVWQGHAVQAQGPLSRRMNFHNDTLPVYEKDIDQAKALLAEAGYPGGGFEVEELVVQGSARQLGAAQILQQGLAELGVTLKISEQSWSAMSARMADPNNPAQMVNWNDYPAYPDPDASLWPLYHTSQQWTGWNITGYGSPETDALLETGRYSSDPTEREAAYTALQQRLFDDHVAIWLVNSTSLVVHRSWLKNFEYDPTWNETVRADRLILDGKP